MPNLIDLKQKRGELIAQMRSLTDLAETEKRDLTGDEDVRHKALFKEQDELRAKIEREERQIELEREMAATAAQKEEGRSKEKEGEETRAESPLASKEYRAGFDSWLRRGMSGLKGEEHRALSAGLDTEGGVFLPVEMQSELIKFLDDEVVIRGLARQFNNVRDLGFPELTADPADADWTTELLTGDEDSSMAFGERELKVHPVAKLIKISNKLLRSANFNVEEFANQRLAYKMGITQEKAFMTGSGAGQPLGLFTASTNGISTARDVSSGNTTTSIQGDGLHAAKWNLKAQYLKNARWLFHRNAMEQISKLKDGNGQYLLKPGLSDEPGDKLLGLPVVMSEYVPNTFTTGLYVGMVGDFSHYWILDAMKYSVQRLVELYARSNQLGLLVRAEVDAAPTVAEAFSRVKLA